MEGLEFLELMFDKNKFKNEWKENNIFSMYLKKILKNHKLEKDVPNTITIFNEKISF
jgi:hypothetical protein